MDLGMQKSPAAFLKQVSVMTLGQLKEKSKSAGTSDHLEGKVKCFSFGQEKG